MGLLSEDARTTDPDAEAVRIRPRIRRVERVVVLAEGERAVPVAVVAVEGVRVLVLATAPQIVVAVMARQEPAERLVEGDAIVDAELARVVLLIGERLEGERRLAL